ncbi:MAG TPA: hypothetical protein VNF04_13050 [Stellaceae bacterium]|nr:hypothetical protein [Stellaceae bacterium]
MPIRPENRDRYPPNWRQISEHIRFGRAGGRCECCGECGIDHRAEPGATTSRPRARCRAVHALPHPVTGSAVVLTVAHLDHMPENVEPGNLRAWCQRCHNTYDAPMRRRNARHRAGQLELPL